MRPWPGWPGSLMTRWLVSSRMSSLLPLSWRRTASMSLVRARSAWAALVSSGVWVMVDVVLGAQDAGQDGGGGGGLGAGGDRLGPGPVVAAAVGEHVLGQDTGLGVGDMQARWLAGGLADGCVQAEDGGFGGEVFEAGDVVGLRAGVHGRCSPSVRLSRFMHSLSSQVYASL